MTYDIKPSSSNSFEEYIDIDINRDIGIDIDMDIDIDIDVDICIVFNILSVLLGQSIPQIFKCRIRKQSKSFAQQMKSALYGSTTVSDTFGDGITENVSMMRSGYSSRTLEINNVPMPAPVPPPREWQSWNPCKQSQPSASFRTTSSTESINSAPSV